MISLFSYCSLKFFVFIFSAEFLERFSFFIVLNFFFWVDSILYFETKSLESTFIDLICLTKNQIDFSGKRIFCFLKTTILNCYVLVVLWNFIKSTSFLNNWMNNIFIGMFLEVCFLKIRIWKVFEKLFFRFFSFFLSKFLVVKVFFIFFVVLSLFMIWIELKIVLKNCCFLLFHGLWKIGCGRFEVVVCLCCLKLFSNFIFWIFFSSNQICEFYRILFFFKYFKIFKIFQSFFFYFWGTLDMNFLVLEFLFSNRRVHFCWSFFISPVFWLKDIENAEMLRNVEFVHCIFLFFLVLSVVGVTPEGLLLFGRNGGVTLNETGHDATSGLNA